MSRNCLRKSNILLSTDIESVRHVGIPSGLSGGTVLIYTNANTSGGPLCRMFLQKQV